MWKKRKGSLGRIMAAGLLAGLLSAGSFAQSAWGAVTDGRTLVEGMNRAEDYYILPDSDKKEISYETMNALTEPRKQMAINEIYARRGRKFVLEEVQKYFNEKTWYRGTVEADEFDEKVFNSYENTNIWKLLNVMDDEWDETEEIVIYTDFAGAYRCITRDREVNISISLYTDYTDLGRERGNVSVNVDYTDGSISYMNGYLYLDHDNVYTLTGTNLSGATLTVTENGITISGLESVSGTYEKLESYRS